MDILTGFIYYVIAAVSFSISTYCTYIRPSIKIARDVADSEDNVLGTGPIRFCLDYIFWATITFPMQLHLILTTDSETVQENIIDVLLNEEEE
jgi:hypothetical protein